MNEPVPPFSPSLDTPLTDQSRAHAPGIHRRSHEADAGPKTPRLALWRSSGPTPGEDEPGKEKKSSPRSGRTPVQVSLLRTALSRSSQSRFTYRRLAAGPEVLTVLRSPASSSRSKFALINPRVMASQQSRVRLSRRAGTPWGARPRETIFIF